jgi:hypothetical protein
MAKTLPTFVELQDLLPYSQNPATGPYHELADAVHNFNYPLCPRSILILSPYLRLGLRSYLVPSGFPTKTLHRPLISPKSATHSVCLIPLDLQQCHYLGKNATYGAPPCVRCTRGSVNSRAGLDGCRKSRPQRDSIPGPPSPLRLSYSGKLSYVLLSTLFLRPQAVSQVFHQHRTNLFWLHAMHSAAPQRCLEQ